MALTGTTPISESKQLRRRVIVAVAVAALIGAIAIDTKVVQIGSETDLRQQAFDPNRFGQSEFPRIRDFVTGRAPAAAELVAALDADRDAAIADYGRMAGAFPVLTARLTGVVGDGSSGIFEIAVDDLPDGPQIRVQTGPAINGTELRDITGDIEFGNFTNQIEYQNAGAGINRAMAAEALSGLDRDALPGQTVTVTGVFTMINPASWLLTPVTFEVAP